MDGNIHQTIFQVSNCLGREELRAYLEDPISAEDRRRVENHLLDCPLCSDALEGLETMGLESLHSLQDFDSFRKNLPVESEAIIRTLTPVKVLSRVAAIAAVLVIGAVAYFNLFQPSGNDALYGQFYSTYQNDIPLNLRSVEGNQLLNPSFEKALENYSAGNFKASLSLFDEFLKTEPDNEAANFYAGMACLETGQWEKANAFFENARKNTGS
jgi:tetratricopeptide (TPR) repeat protein